MLSLLIALGTVISFGVPYLLKAFENPDSDLKAYYIEMHRNKEIDIYCVNDGKRPGLVHNANLEFQYEKDTFYITLLRTLALVQNDTLMKEGDRRARNLYELYPSKTVLFRYRPVPGIPQKITKKGVQYDINNRPEKFDLNHADLTKITGASLNLVMTSFQGRVSKQEVTFNEGNIDQVFETIFKHTTGRELAR